MNPYEEERAKREESSAILGASLVGGGSRGMGLRPKATEGGILSLVSCISSLLDEQEQEIKSLVEKLGPIVSENKNITGAPQSGERAMPSVSSVIGQHLTNATNRIAQNTDYLRAIRHMLEV